jgi:hypothetical protein
MILGVKMDKTTYLVFLLDETGSMESIKDDPIGGFNQFLDALDEKLPFEITLIKWDSNKQEVVCTGAKPKDVPRLTKESYRPGAATPLVDVVYNAIKKTEEKISKRKKIQVQIVIQTDGLENASVEHTSDELHALVKEKTEAGWLFTFIGAGIDAFAQAGKIGIAVGATLGYDRNKTPVAFAAAARGTQSYASTGESSSADFTEEERKNTGGHVAPKKEKEPEPLTNVDW